MAVDSDDAAVRLMNDSPYGLTAWVCTARRGGARRIGRRFQTGTVFVNRCDYLDPGARLDRRQGHRPRRVAVSVGYEHMTRPKSFHLKSL